MLLFYKLKSLESHFNLSTAYQFSHPVPDLILRQHPEGPFVCQQSYKVCFCPQIGYSERSCGLCKSLRLKFTSIAYITACANAFES